MTPSLCAADPCGRPVGGGHLGPQEATAGSGVSGLGIVMDVGPLQATCDSPRLFSVIGSGRVSASSLRSLLGFQLRLREAFSVFPRVSCVQRTFFSAFSVCLVECSPGRDLLSPVNSMPPKGISGVALNFRLLCVGRWSSAGWPARPEPKFWSCFLKGTQDRCCRRHLTGASPRTRGIVGQRPIRCRRAPTGRALPLLCVSVLLLLRD